MGCEISKAPEGGASALIGLNDDLNREILKRLPMDSLLRFRLVSKYWHLLISDYLLLGRTSAFLVIKVPERPSNDEMGVMPVPNFLPLRPMDTLITPQNLPSLPNRMDYCLVSLSDNLLLYYLFCPGHNTPTYIVYNPATAQSITLPPAFDRGVFLTAGFDYDPRTGHLMAARFIKGGSPGSPGPDSSVLELYSSTTNVWREFGTALGTVDPEHRLRGGDDADHVSWILFNRDSLFVCFACYASYLLRFDLRSRAFQPVELPGFDKSLQIGTVGRCKGDVLYGWTHRLRFRLWKLESEGARSRWTRIHKQSCISLGKQLREHALADPRTKVLGFFTDSEIMLLYMNKNVFLYELCTGRLMHVLEVGDESETSVIPFSLSPSYIPMVEESSSFAQLKRFFFSFLCT